MFVLIEVINKGRGFIKDRSVASEKKKIGSFQAAK